mmetsp:Transcript_13448/g.26625  ORF Transcript_13448/g.26625 Transcript_13448/m.26625 type:complete len:154 (-) Transcript_13448:142-603(-)
MQAARLLLDRSRAKSFFSIFLLVGSFVTLSCLLFFQASLSFFLSVSVCVSFFLSVSVACASSIIRLDPCRGVQLAGKKHGEKNALSKTKETEAREKMEESRLSLRRRVKMDCSSNCLPVLKVLEQLSQRSTCKPYSLIFALQDCYLDAWGVTA